MARRTTEQMVEYWDERVIKTMAILQEVQARLEKYKNERDKARRKIEIKALIENEEKKFKERIKAIKDGKMR